MPRGARLDAPGTLHHVIIRGIERDAIFTDNEDRREFLRRMGTLATGSGTAIYAYALMTNHLHLREILDSLNKRSLGLIYGELCVGGSNHQ
jgi:putative transposase